MAVIKTVLTDAPDRIHLVIEDEQGEFPFASWDHASSAAQEGNGVLWREDRQGPSDIEYIRADLVDGLIERAVLEAAPESSAIAMQAVDAERWRAVRDYLASTRADLDDDFLEACSSADTLLLCAFADNLILQSSQPSPVQLKEDLLPESLPYGIVDPDYARIFTMARVLAWAEGYAITMHGSFTRDLDLLAVPWTDRACEPEHLVRRIEAACKLRLNGHPPGAKSHGRLAWTLLFPEFGDPRFVDLSVMPRVHPSPVQASDAGKAGMSEQSKPLCAV